MQRCTSNENFDKINSDIKIEFNFLKRMNKQKLQKNALQINSE